jgi:hypothetical protein
MTHDAYFKKIGDNLATSIRIKLEDFYSLTKSFLK